MIVPLWNKKIFWKALAWSNLEPSQLLQSRVGNLRGISPYKFTLIVGADPCMRFAVFMSSGYGDLELGPTQALTLTRPLQSGGYDLDLFASPPDCKFLCAISRGVLKTPMRLPCSHIFCKNQWLTRCHWEPRRAGVRAGGQFL